MKPHLRLPLAIPILAFAAIFATASSALPAPQSNPSSSIEDISAIGNRNVSGRVNFYPIEKEIAIGKQLAQEVERSSKFINDPVIIEYVSRIGQTIAQNSDARFPIVIRVLDSDVVNGFTLPGGYLYINRGLILQMESEAELAGVLARAIAHTALRHATRQATRGEMLQLASIPPTIFMPSSMANYAMYEGLNLSIPLSTLKFQRDAEREADFFGLEYLYKAGYDPGSLPRFLERMSLQKSSGKSIPPAFDSFPPVSERVASMNKEIAKILPHRDDAIVSTPEFEIIKARLRASHPKQTDAPSDNRSKPILRKPGDNPTPEPFIPIPNCK